MASATAAISGRTKALHLYRSLLKAHKVHLPPEMRQLGDTYVKSEFKLHKGAKPEHLTGFYQEWGNYLDSILMTARTRDHGAMVDQSAAQQMAAFGRDLPKGLELQEEQMQQLNALREEAENLGRHNNNK